MSNSNGTYQWLKKVGVIVSILALLFTMAVTAFTAIRQSKIDVILETKEIFYPKADGQQLEERLNNIESNFERLYIENKDEHDLMLH